MRPNFRFSRQNLIGVESITDDIFAIPTEGLISIKNLSNLTGINIESLTQSLSNNKVPVLKLGSYKKDWYVSLRKLAEIAEA